MKEKEDLLLVSWKKKIMRCWFKVSNSSLISGARSTRRLKRLLEAKIQTLPWTVEVIGWIWNLQHCETWQHSHQCFYRDRGEENFYMFLSGRRKPVISSWSCQKGIPLFFLFLDGSELGLIVSTLPSRELTFLLVSQENNLFYLFHSFSFSL